MDRKECSNWTVVHAGQTLVTGSKGLCKDKKIPKIQKKFGSGWVGPGLIWIKKKLENRPKTKFCVCTIRSLLTACIVNAIVLHKQRSRKSTKPAMCV